MIIFVRLKAITEWFKAYVVRFSEIISTCQHSVAKLIKLASLRAPFPKKSLQGLFKVHIPLDYGQTKIYSMVKDTEDPSLIFL